MKLKILCSAITIALLSAQTNAEDTKKVDSPFKIEQFKPSAENSNLYKDYRKDWIRLSGFELSALHWNQFVAVFTNQAADIYRNNYLEYVRTSQDDYDEDEEEEDEDGNIITKYKPYPEGTVIIKEGFSSSEGKPGAPIFIVLMKKHPKGYDTTNGDWEYMKFTSDGSEIMRGKASDPAVAAQCANCHINVADRDYVFSSFFSGKTN